jgi:NAD+ synthase
MALPQRVLGVLMPCYSHPQDEDDARLVASTFAFPIAKVDLEAPFDALTESLQHAVRNLPTHVDSVDIKQQMPDANLKPRLRMTSLYFIANSLNYLVAGTGNRSEITLGYYTKYGDGGVDVLPIGGLLKSEVRALARELGVTGTNHHQAPHGRALGGPDRRSGDGLQLRNARGVSGGRTRQSPRKCGGAD